MELIHIAITSLTIVIVIYIIIVYRIHLQKKIGMLASLGFVHSAACPLHGLLPKLGILAAGSGSIGILYTYHHMQVRIVEYLTGVNHSTAHTIVDVFNYGILFASSVYIASKILQWYKKYKSGID